MKIEVDTIDRALPRVKWVQKLSKETKGRKLARNAMIGFAVVGALIGYDSTGGWQGLSGGAFVGALFAMWSLGKGMENLHQQDWAATPILTNCKGQSFLSGPEDGELVFNWCFETPAGELVSDKLPLSDFDVFELGTMNEWFAGSDDKKKFGDCFAIVLHAESGGTKCVAAHAGNKGEMANLHGVLTREFVAKRSDLLKRRTPKLARTALASRYSNDLPKTL